MASPKTLAIPPARGPFFYWETAKAVTSPNYQNRHARRATARRIRHLRPARVRRAEKMLAIRSRPY